MKPLKLRVYEQLCPNDPIDSTDPRRAAIIAEMDVILDPRRSAKLIAPMIYRWWGKPFTSVTDAELWVLKAREVARELRGAK